MEIHILQYCIILVCLPEDKNTFCGRISIFLVFFYYSQFSSIFHQLLKWSIFVPLLPLYNSVILFYVLLLYTEAVVEKITKREIEEEGIRDREKERRMKQTTQGHILCHERKMIRTRACMCNIYTHTHTYFSLINHTNISI